MIKFDPPQPPACTDDNPELFDNEFTYGMALAICQGCPIQDWCLDWVDPSRNHYDGVAGGVVWAEGRPVRKWTPIRQQMHLVTYLATRGHLKKLDPKAQ